MQNGSPGSTESNHIFSRPYFRPNRPIYVIRYPADLAGNSAGIGRKIYFSDSVDPGDPFCTLDHLHNSICDDFEPYRKSVKIHFRRNSKKTPEISDHHFGLKIANFKIFSKCFLWGLHLIMKSARRAFTCSIGVSGRLWTAFGKNVGWTVFFWPKMDILRF